MAGKRRGVFIALVLLALLCGARALAAMSESVDMLLNERLSVPADGRAHAYAFSPTANNLYAIASFGGSGAAARLYLEGEETPIAEAEGFAFEVRLIADRVYRLEVTAGESPVEVEVMRAALGRSFDQPIEIKDLSVGYDKLIARAYDTHWYRFTAPVSGFYAIATRSDLNTVGYLLDEGGARVAMNDNLYAPYCLDFRIQQWLSAGHTYVVRVSGRGEETGVYHLSVTSPQPGAVVPESITAQQEVLSLSENERAALAYALAPDNAIKDVRFISADPRVASVSEDGVVTAKRAGQTQVILVGAGSAETRVDVLVEGVPATGVIPGETEVTRHAGETFALSFTVEPETASDRRVTLVSSDLSVVTVGEDGTLFALKEGTANVTAVTRDGAFRASTLVSVEPALSAYRVLALGEQRYEDGRVRIGSINTTQGVADLFKRQVYEGGPAQVTARLDATRSEAVAAIRTAFADAKPTDVSILYINCHGGYTDGQAWLQFVDGERLTAAQLERELRRIPGIVVLLIDCCQSGAFLSDRDAADFAGRMEQVFTSGMRAGRLLSGKYQIMTSASSSQDSYRISYDGGSSESSMATVFARSLAEAGGWDLVLDRAGRLRADLDQDGSVTLLEAFRYARRRVRQYLEQADVAQDVQLHATADSLILFRRA